VKLPREIVSLLGVEPEAGHHVGLRAGLDTVLGESHLVLVGGELRIVSRSSLLDPFVELVDVRSARLAQAALGSELSFAHRGGVATIRLGYGEDEAVAALLERREASTPPSPPPAALEASALPCPSPAEPSAPSLTEARAEAAPTGSSGAASAERSALRSGLLTLLASRGPRDAERRMLLSLLAGRRRILGERRPERSATEARLAAALAAREQSHASPGVVPRAHAARVRPEPARERTPSVPPGPLREARPSSAPWLVLLALLALGLGLALRAIVAR